MFSMNTPHEEACFENTGSSPSLMEISQRGYTSADRECLCYPPMETPQEGCTSVSNHRTLFVPFTDANIPKGIELSYSNLQLIKEEKEGNKVEKGGIGSGCSHHESGDPKGTFKDVGNPPMCKCRMQAQHGGLREERR